MEKKKQHKTMEQAIVLHTHTLRSQHIKWIVWHGRRVYYFNANSKCGNCASQHVAKKRSTYIHTSIYKYSTLCARTQASMYLYVPPHCVYISTDLCTCAYMCVCAYTCSVATVAAASAAALSTCAWRCIYCRALCTCCFYIKTNSMRTW